jgi:hypothetical protein
LPGDISIRDFTINNGALNLASFTLTVIRTATITGGTISNGTLNVRDYNSLQNTTFNGAITLIKTGPANDDTNGGNIYNGPTTIRNNGNRWRHANTNGDIFNSTVTFIKNSNGNLEVAYNGANTFNGQVTINNFIANGTFSIGLGGGTSTLNMGGLVTSSFALGNLDVRNFTQVTNTLNGTFAPATFTIGNSTLLGSFSITAANGITVLGNNRFCTGSGSLCTFVKNGGGNSDWVGGNTFGTVSITNNDINSRFRLANSGGGDIFTSTSTFTNSGTQFFEIARTGTNTFANSITINNNNSAGEVTFGAGGGTSTLTTGGVVTTGFSVGNILSFTNFTQIQNSPNSNFGVTTFTSTNSSFQGDFGVNATTINFTQTNTFARNGTFTATNINQTLAGSSFATAGGSVTFTKTGGGTNQWYGGNTFGIASFINNSNALFRLAGNAGDTYTSTSTFTNTGTNFLGIAFRGTNNFAQQITINNSNAAGEIRFGEGGGTSTLAAGGVVTSGFSVGNILEFNNFTQSQNALNGTFGVTTFTSVNSSFQGDFGVTATTINFTQANTFARNGTFTAANINMTQAGNSFATLGGIANFTKTGGGANNWFGGNTFGASTITNSSTANLRLANNSGDTFNNSVTFIKSGSGNVEPAYNGTTNFNGNISTVGSNASLTFGVGTGVAQINGSGAQSLSGASANSPIFRRMILDKSGFFTLNVPLQISLSGTFTNGVLNSSTSNSLTFINNATASGASDASYVAGPVVKIGNSNFEFPIGKGGFYAPSILGIGGGTSDSYTSEYFNIAPHAIPTDTIGKEPTIGLMNKSEHWSFTRSSGTVARSLALGYNSARTSSIIDHNELIMIYWDLAIWRNVGGVVSGNATNGVVTRAPNPSFGLFSIASSFRILPIALLEFKAEKTQEKNIRVNWITATEKNNAFFTLEKSLDGKVWQTIAIIPGSGNSQEQISYEFIDKDVRYGRQFYRLTQTDYDGRFETFQVIGISLVQEQGVSGVYKIYPNPSSGRFTLQSENMNLEETALEIYDLNGSLVLKSSEMKNKKQEFDLSSMPKGIYVVKLFSLEGLVTKKLIIH